jgi:tRNA pseudouridine55 synthase
MISGLFNLNKPQGMTSRWTVDQVQRLVRPAKAGHAGTLDPLATGVLVVAVGQATRLVEYVQQLPKQYRADFLLGRTSTTEDVDGEVSELLDPPIPSRSEIQHAAEKFLGKIMQRPPAFSALKVAGKRAYALARRGHEVELQPRPVRVHRLEIIEIDYPRLMLEIECSSGTYVRSLGRDLAESLGTGAIMSALERTAIGSFHIQDAIDVQSLSRDNIADHLLPPRSAVEHLPPINLSPTECERISRGQFIDFPCAAVKPTAHHSPLTTHSDSSDFAAFDDRENLVAILRQRPDGQLGPLRNFTAS